MGMIRITVAGSFGNAEKTFTAMKHGHADAVSQAIEYLSGDLLPKSIRQDHELQAQGEKPEGPFGRDVQK